MLSAGKSSKSTGSVGERVVRWNDDHKPLSDTLYYYFANQHMVDVTVVCKDGELRAHRLVLCAGSKYFQDMLLDVDLKGCKYMMREDNVPRRMMLLLMEFLYRGLVPISNHELKGFLEAAAQYDVRDIVVSGDSQSTSPAKAKSGCSKDFPKP